MLQSLLAELTKEGSEQETICYKGAKRQHVTADGLSRGGRDSGDHVQSGVQLDTRAVEDVARRMGGFAPIPVDSYAEGAQLAAAIAASMAAVDEESRGTGDTAGHSTSGSSTRPVDVDDGSAQSILGNNNNDSASLQRKAS